MYVLAWYDCFLIVGWFLHYLYGYEGFKTYNKVKKLIFNL